MTILVTPEEMRIAEQATIASGVSARDLMRRAGTAIADWVERIVSMPEQREPRAVGLVGPGNNGGDTLVALATLYERGWNCAAIFVGRVEIGDVPASSESLAKITRISPEQLAAFRSDAILDGIYGIGGRATLLDVSRVAIAAARHERSLRRVPLVAVDLPSGVDGASGAADSATFPADVTLCLGLPKIGLTREPAATFVGELIVIDIGILSQAADGRPEMLDEHLARRLVPRRRASAHKSNTGATLVIGGADRYFGAPRLSGEAALRVGAGLVTLAAPEAIIVPIAGQVPELTFLQLSGDGDDQARTILAFVESQPGRYSSIVFGPGLGLDERAVSLLDRLLASDNRHFQQMCCVLDADALNWLSTKPHIVKALEHLRCVLTPHPGEMARLVNMTPEEVLEDTVALGRESARNWNQVVVLKSGYSLVAAPNGQVWIAPRAMPELATSGTGDVLSGLIGGLLAQSAEPLDAARLGMYVGSMAGRAARGEYGVAGVVATDVIKRVPSVLRTLAEPAWDQQWLSRS